MAMLAESRRKQKISSDPRGNAWRNDTNKFGQKLMEKMGWAEGKGLGAKEDGNVDHILVTHKADTRGVGCSKSQADNWIAHQDDFSDLLAQLNESHGKDTSNDSVQKMEEKSKTAKGRVHYQKFTKGKDLSAKSEVDLDCVFGKRKPKSGQNTPDVQASSDESDDPMASSYGVKTIRSTDSIQDYFAKKMVEKLGKGSGITNGIDSPGTNEADGNDAQDANETEVTTGEIKKKKKSKKDKKKKRLAGNEEFVKQDKDDDYDSVEKRVSFMLGSDELEGVNDEKTKQANIVIEDCADKTVDNGDIVKKSKKSKKKRKHKDAFKEDNTVEVEGAKENNQDLDDAELTSSKKSKKSKKDKKRKNNE